MLIIKLAIYFNYTLIETYLKKKALTALSLVDNVFFSYWIVTLWAALLLISFLFEMYICACFLKSFLGRKEK